MARDRCWMSGGLLEDVGEPNDQAFECQVRWTTARLPEPVAGEHILKPGSHFLQIFDSPRVGGVGKVSILEAPRPSGALCPLKGQRQLLKSRRGGLGRPSDMTQIPAMAGDASTRVQMSAYATHCRINEDIGIARYPNRLPAAAKTIHFAELAKDEVLAAAVLSGKYLLERTRCFIGKLPDMNVARGVRGFHHSSSRDAEASDQLPAGLSVRGIVRLKLSVL